MNFSYKVKKTIRKSQIDKILRWELLLTDSDTWEILDVKIRESKYKLTLSNNKKFMKKWTDRKLNIAIKKELSPLWKEILFDILDYVDDDNIINFKILANDYWYSPSKISKAKSILEDKGIIKKSGWLYYLSPIVWISQKEISQELIHLFKDSFEKYNVEINLK